MRKLSLEALAHEHLSRAAASSAGRSAETIYGGHERTLRQTLVALTAGSALSEHESPGEATVQVPVWTGAGQRGERRLGRPHRRPDRPSASRHDLRAAEDAVVLLTVGAHYRD